VRAHTDNRSTARPLSSPALRASLLVALCTCALCALALVAPGAAPAKRLSSDSISGVPLSACDPSRSVAPDINAASGVIATDDGRILWSRRPSEPRAMASTTKIMTALLVLEQGNLDEVATVSKAAAGVDYSTGLRPGERIPVGKLLELALVASSNDAALALAEHVGGDVATFVDRMNARASELGLGDTHFVNPHGLDAAGHHSSAADLAVLSRTAMGSAEFRRIVALRSVRLPAYKKRAARTIRSTDELLGRYPGLLGVKTGFTDDAKYSFVACAQRDGISLTAVILGASSNSARFKQSKRLLDWGFRHVDVKTVATATETVGAVPVAADPRVEIPVRFAETTATAVFDLDGPLTRSASLVDRVSLPVFQGQPLGTVAVRQGDRVLATLPAVAASDLASVGETVGVVPVVDYLDRTVTARAAETSVPVPAFDPKTPVKRRVVLDPHVSAPVAAGQVVGQIVYSQGATVLVRVPAVAASAVEEPGVFDKVGTWFARGWRALTGAPSMASLQVD